MGLELGWVAWDLLDNCRCVRWLGRFCPCGADPRGFLMGVVEDGAVARPACRHRIPYLRYRTYRCIRCGRESDWCEWWG